MKLNHAPILAILLSAGITACNKPPQYNASASANPVHSENAEPGIKPKGNGSETAKTSDAIPDSSWKESDASAMPEKAEIPMGEEEWNKGSEPVTTPEISQPPKENALNCKDFNWESIKRPDDASCFASKEAAFASIPDFIRPFWVLMKQSRSAQSSTLENPRAIVVSPDGSFIVGAATDPKARNDLEVAVYDYEKNEWQFAGIDFTTNPPKIEKELCKSCHGKEHQHPIWTQYGNWRGAIGTNNTLSDEDAAQMQKIVAGTQTSPILKSLVFQKASSYTTGKRLGPATRYYPGENSQVLNYVTMQKAAQSTAARIARDPKVTVKDILQMSSDITCNNRSFTTLKKFGYPIEKTIMLGLEGSDRATDMFNGRFNASAYLGVELLARAMAMDPSLKDKLPLATKQFADPRYKYFTTKNAGEYKALMPVLKKGIRDIQSNFLSPTGNGLGAALKSTEHCEAIKDLFQ